MNKSNLAFGSELSTNDRQKVLARFVHRYTKNHIPSWVRLAEENEGKKYPVQFASDNDWLFNTEFFVNENGKLSNLASSCFSHPTWPEGKDIINLISTLSK